MPFWQGWIECGICGDKHVAVIEVDDGQDEPIVNMECPACESMACTPSEPPTPTS